MAPCNQVHLSGMSDLVYAKIVTYGEAKWGKEIYMFKKRLTDRLLCKQTEIYMIKYLGFQKRANEPILLMSNLSFGQGTQLQG